MKTCPVQITQNHNTLAVIYCKNWLWAHILKWVWESAPVDLSVWAKVNPYWVELRDANIEEGK